MAEPRRRDRVRDWWRRRSGIVAGVLALVLVAGGVALTVRPELGGVPRRVVKRLDHALLGGLLQRMALGDAPTRAEHLDVPPARPGAYAWLPESGFLAIAHALGPSIETGRNTLATFRAGRAVGFRVFEVDLILTADGVLACHHGAPNEVVDTLTWADVQRLAPDACRFEELVAALAGDPEVRIVLDVKSRFDAAYDEVLRIARAAGVADRLIPQIYHFSQARRLRESGELAGLLFTAYRSALPLDRVLASARAAGVPVVTVPVEALAGWRGTLPEAPRVLAHPVNDPFEAVRLRATGVDGIYTSYLAPDAAGAGG